MHAPHGIFDPNSLRTWNFDNEKIFRMKPTKNNHLVGEVLIDGIKKKVRVANLREINSMWLSSQEKVHQYFSHVYPALTHIPRTDEYCVHFFVRGSGGMDNPPTGEDDDESGEGKKPTPLKEGADGILVPVKSGGSPKNPKSVKNAKQIAKTNEQNIIQSTQALHALAVDVMQDTSKSLKASLASLDDEHKSLSEDRRNQRKIKLQEKSKNEETLNKEFVGMSLKDSSSETNEKFAEKSETLRDKQMDDFESDQAMLKKDGTDARQEALANADTKNKLVKGTIKTQSESIGTLIDIRNRMVRESENDSKLALALKKEQQDAQIAFQKALATAKTEAKRQEYKDKTLDPDNIQQRYDAAWVKYNAALDYAKATYSNITYKMPTVNFDTGVVTEGSVDGRNLLSGSIK